jgi:hypothetical protein
MGQPKRFEEDASSKAKTAYLKLTCGSTVDSKNFKGQEIPHQYDPN